MNAADLILIALGAFFVIRGLFKGLTGEVLSLLSAIGGFYCSMRFYEPLASLIEGAVGVSPLAANAVAMIAIFLAIFLLCMVANKTLKAVLRGTHLTWLDKIIGAFSGLVKIYVVTIVLLIAGMMVSPMTGDEWMRGSKVMTVAARTWPFVTRLLEGFGIMPDIDRLRDAAREHIARQASQDLVGGGTSFESFFSGEPIEQDDPAPPASHDLP